MWLAFQFLHVLYQVQSLAKESIEVEWRLPLEIEQSTEAMDYVQKCL